MSLANTNALLKQLITKYLEIVTKLNQIYAERINDLMNQQQKIQKQINQLFLTHYANIMETLQQESITASNSYISSEHGITNDEETIEKNNQIQNVFVEQNKKVVDKQKKISNNPSLLHTKSGILLLLEAAELIQQEQCTNNCSEWERLRTDVISAKEKNYIDIRSPTSRNTEYQIHSESTLNKFQSKLFLCTHCNKRFERKVLLKRHITLEHNQEIIKQRQTNKRHHCVYCHKSYKMKAGLKRHIRNKHTLNSMSHNKELYNNKEF